MRPAKDGHACPGGWRHLSVNPQAKLHGQVDVLFSGPATNTGGQWRGAGSDQTRPMAGGLKLLDLGQLDTVSRHVRQLPTASDSTVHAHKRSFTDAGGRRRSGHQKLTESGGRMDKHMARASSVSGNIGVRCVSGNADVRCVSGNTDVRCVSGNTDVRCVSRRGLTTNSNNNSCPPARRVTTNSNNSCVSAPPAMPPVCPDITTSSDQLVLGPDHIDMLLALAASNCTGNEMVGCCKMALQSSHVGNILRNYLVAVKYRLQDVMDKMINVIRRNFLCISRSREFLSLPLEYILMFMEDTHLNVQNELDMFVTALLWIDYNKQERLEYAGCVLKCVRYAHIAPADIQEYVEPNLHLFTGQDGADTLVNLYKHHAFIQSGQPLPGYTSMIPPKRGMHGVPARAYITSGAADMIPASGAGGHSAACRAWRGAGAMPTDELSSSMRKTKVTFASSTQLFSPGDTPPQSESQLPPAAGTAPAGETPAAGAEKGAATPEKSAATPEKDAATPEKGAATPEKGAPTPEKDVATPEKDVATPEKGAATPEKDAATPEKGAATPEKDAATPAVEGATPEKGAAAGAEKSAATPEKGAATPEKDAATPEKGVATPTVEGAAPEKGAVTAIVGKAPSEKGANASAVGDKQPKKAVTTPVAAGTQRVSASSSAATSGKPPGNVQDRSNNSQLWDAPYGSRVYGDHSLWAWQAGGQQWPPSRQSGMEGRSGVEGRLYFAGPFRAGNVGPATASGCHDLYMNTSGCQNHSMFPSGCQNHSMFASGCQNHSMFASGCQNHSMFASGCQNHSMFASGYEQYPKTPNVCDNHSMVANGCQNHVMAANTSGQGWGQPVKGQPTVHDTRHVLNGSMGGQHSAVLETDAGRKRTSSRQYISEQCQQRSSKQFHPKQVFVITKSLSGPVVSIAYPHNDETQAS
ncbi:hypothetical protein BsWGS_11299 [Bradybaena similaris]